MPINIHVVVFRAALRIVCLVLTALPILALASGAYAFSCPPKGPVATGSRVTVVYDPADTTMKACVNGSWVTMAGGGGGGGGNLDSLSDVIVTSPANNQVLLFNGSNWVNSAVTVTESDPQVGTLSGSQWCAANAGGTAIDCNQAAPSGAASSGTAGYIQFSGGSGTFANSGTTAGQQLFWDNTNKRLGIGTAAPTTPLHINATGNSSVQTTGTTFGTFFGVAGTTSAILQADASGKVFLGASSNHPVGLITNNIERLTLLANGNVGIGTSTPRQPLHVQGNGTDTGLMIGGAGTVAFTLFNTTGAQDALRIRSQNYDGSNSNERMTILGNGNVGIGTTNPQARLDVSHTGSAVAGAIRIGDPAAIANNTGLYGRTSGVFTLGAAGGDIVFDTNYGSAERIRIQHSTGNVGIGTSSPADRLHVQGLVRIDKQDSVAEGGQLTLMDAVGAGAWEIDNYGVNGSEILRIFRDKAGENQIIGFNFTPAGNLEIAGQAFKLGGGAWAASSDARLKDVDGVYERGLESIVSLNTIRFHYKKGNPRREPSDRPYVGLIAQDVQKVFPEAVQERGDGFLDLDTTPINFALINAVKELKLSNDKLKAITDRQAAELQELRKAFEAYKAHTQ